MSNCMLCAVLHCLPLSCPLRIYLLRLPLSQSTPLPPAQPLTRWRDHLQQVVAVPTQDLPLNLWPTLLNLTPRAHRIVPVCSSHKMGRWIGKSIVRKLQNHNVTYAVRLMYLISKQNFLKNSLHCRIFDKTQLQTNNLIVRNPRQTQGKGLVTPLSDKKRHVKLKMIYIV